jgi:oligosaccharide repeat unit polymerase
MIDIAYKLLAILCSFLFLAQAFYIKRRVGTFIFPAALFSLAWFFFTFIPFVALFVVPVNPIGVLYIFACTLAFSLGALPFNWTQAFIDHGKIAHDGDERFESRLIRYALYLSAISSIVWSTASLVANGIDLQALFLDLLDTSGRFATTRGQGESEYGIAGTLSIFFTYSSAALGGLSFGPSRKGTRRWPSLLAAFTPSLYFMLIQSAKLVLFYSLAFYIAGILLRKVQANRLDLGGWPLVRRALVFAVVVFPLLVLSFMSRFYALDLGGAGELLDILMFSLNSYAFGQVYAFSDFFTYYVGARSELAYVHDFNAYGYYTFKSVMDALGGDKYFPPEWFQDFYFHEEIVSTNIFTLFRGLIYDFGGVGALLAMFAMGLVAHAFYHRLLTARRAWVASSAFMVTVVFIQGSYLLSLFVARFAILLLVAFALLFWVNDRSTNIQDQEMKS